MNLGDKDGNNEKEKRMQRDDDIIMEESPIEDSMSNGYIERAIQTVQDQVRTMKSALEGRLGEEVNRTIRDCRG